MNERSSWNVHSGVLRFVRLLYVLSYFAGTFFRFVYITLPPVQRFSSKNQFRMEQHSRVSSRPLLITPRGRYWSKWMREVAGLLIPSDNCVCTCSTFCRTSSELFSVLCTLLYQRLTIFSKNRFRMEQPRRASVGSSLKNIPTLSPDSYKKSRALAKATLLGAAPP